MEEQEAAASEEARAEVDLAEAASEEAGRVAFTADLAVRTIITTITCQDATFSGAFGHADIITAEADALVDSSV